MYGGINLFLFMFFTQLIERKACKLEIDQYNHA